MSVPKSVVKINKNGVQYTSSVDRVSYTIRELTRAALRDVGRFVSRTCNSTAMQLPGLKKSRRVRGKSSAFQFWVRKQEADLQVGIRHGTWYGTDQELGSKNQPKRGILRNAVYNNIRQIIEIESQYLSALENEAAALAKISEEEYQGGGDD
ncbi:MAG: hypothetical protein PUF71_02915 [Firmicutes bacterium]|nr:hypothetical protein [Bacillota bacterium]